MTEEMTPGIREWRGLYESAVRVKEVSPWEWMTETDVFGVRSPESGELGFVSVMGLLGEHYAVSLYLGSEGIHGFLDLQEMGPFADPEALIQIPQIQASFENREELEKRDREVIKELGLKFRGRNAWPMFRSYSPSLFPWFLEAGEVRFLSCALEQLVDVAPPSERILLCWSLPAAIAICYASPARKGGGVSGKTLRRVYLHWTLRPSKSRWRRPRSSLSGGCREGTGVWRWTSSYSPHPSRMRVIVRTSCTCCW
jgi:hypothetical protein